MSLVSDAKDELGCDILNKFFDCLNSWTKHQSLKKRITDDEYREVLVSSILYTWWNKRDGDEIAKKSIEVYIESKGFFQEAFKIYIREVKKFKRKTN